ncbi:phosphatases II, partial [Acephala macrosclerotiorum]
LDEITPGLFLGNIESILDEPTVRENNIKAAISVTSRDYVQWHEPQFIEMFPHHIWIQAEDDSKQELLRYMSQCCDFIDENLKPTSTSSPEDPSVGESGSKPEVSKVLVHCRMGISRSATIIIAYLMRKKRLSAEDALAYVRVNRWIANPNANFMAQLKIWEDVQYEIWEDKDKKIPKPAYQKYLEEKQFKLEVK